MMMYRYDKYKGIMIPIKTKKQKFKGFLKKSTIICSVATLFFMGACTYLFIDDTFEYRKNISVLENRLNLYTSRNKQLTTKNIGYSKEIKELQQFISENKLEEVVNQNAQLVTDNSELKDKNVALLEYIKLKTGTVITDIKRVNLEVTKYTNEEGWWKPGDPNWGTMASGKKTFDGASAMPKSIPFGTEVVIDQSTNVTMASRGAGTRRDDYGLDKVFQVLDRGSAIVEKYKGDEKYYCIDLWTDSLQEANKWGRRTKEGWLYYVKDNK